jgi:hypothetical protein
MRIGPDAATADANRRAPARRSRIAARALVAACAFAAASLPADACAQLYRSAAFTVTDTSVHQGDFRSIAISRDRIESNYQRAAAEVNFKFSINGFDNEHPPGDDYMIYLRPEGGRIVSPVYRFGELEAPVTPEPELAILNVEEGPVDVTFRLDMRHVLDSLRVHGVYTPPNGAPIRRAELEAVYIIGNTTPLSWDFSVLRPGAPVELRDEDGDGIYEVTLRFDAHFSRPVTPDGRVVWERTRELARFPVLESPQRLVDGLHRLALEELLQLERDDGALNAGGRWPGVWTRDLAWGALLGIVFAMPEAVHAGLLARVDSLGRIIQDSGSGGSWPVSTDRVAWALAAWELFAVTGDTAWLRTAYDVIRRSAEADIVVAFDSATGLFRGESTFLDWREQSYPRWMDPKDIGHSQALGTNVLHYATYGVLARMAGLLGEPASRWEAVAAAVHDALQAQLWLPEHGHFAQYRYGRLAQLISPRADMLGEALAIIHGVHDADQRVLSVAIAPVVTFGVPSFWPYIPDVPPYHNAGVWPQVVGFWAWAAADAGNEAAVAHALANLYRGTALFLTNKENWVAATGHFEGTEVNSDRFMASAAAQLATSYRVLFGMRLEEDRLVFRPFVPRAWAGERTLRNLRYRNATLTVTIHGSGGSVREVRLDGVRIPRAEIPATLAGEHSLEIVLDDRVPAGAINLVGDVRAPRTPRAERGGQTVTWQAVAGAAHYVVYHGGEPTATTRDTVWAVAPGAGVAELQVMAVDAAGRASFLSEPLRVGPDDATVTVEAAGVPLETEHDGYEGAGYVTLTATSNTSVAFQVTVPADGWYAIDVRYANGGGAVSYGYRGAARALLVNGRAAGTLLLPQRGIQRWESWGHSNAVHVHLSAGTHSITVGYGAEFRNMDGAEDRALLDHLRIARLQR